MSDVPFWTAAAGLAALAWLMLAMPGRPGRFRRPPSGPAATRDASNLGVLKEQLATLNAELAAGSIDAAEHRQARAEIERRVFDENIEGASALDVEASGTGLHRHALIGLALAIPLFAFGVYGFLGNLDGLAVPEPDVVAAPKPEEASPQAVEAMLDDMARRMKAQAAGSTDAAGWALLGRSYAALQRFQDASDAYARAVALAPNDAQLMVDHADVLSMLQNRSTAGEPQRLIDRALKIDPNNLKGLALAGSAAFERADYPSAMAYWSKARGLAKPGPFADSVERGLAEARTAMGGADAGAGAGTGTGTGSDAQAVAGAGSDAAQRSAQVASPGSASAATPAASTSAAQVRGRVTLAPELAARIQPDDTVFVFARAENGPRMPLAIARYKASALPIDFKLDDSSAMSPALRLSTFGRVVIGARVSRTGSATPNSGDLQGLSAPMGNDNGDVRLVIDGITP